MEDKGPLRTTIAIALIKPRAETPPIRTLALVYSTRKSILVIVIFEPRSDKKIDAIKITRQSITRVFLVFRMFRIFRIASFKCDPTISYTPFSVRHSFELSSTSVPPRSALGKDFSKFFCFRNFIDLRIFNN